MGDTLGFQEHVLALLYKKWKCTDTCIYLYQTPSNGKTTEEVVVFIFISKPNKGPVNQHIKYPGVFKIGSWGWILGL